MKTLEQRIGDILRAGTMLSSLLFAAGLVMALAGYGTELSDVLLATAVVVLMATPVLRVVVSVIEYARAGDWVFVGLTMIVLCALGASVIAAYL